MTQRRCVTAQLPPPLWAKLVALHEQYPGVSKHALIKAALSLAADADPAELQRHVGRH